ncbi:hypothetical protein TNCV_2735071 [Trichonephila clavipes]|nr:hypothetical protein TNCV_2735071 [Trichonephila clavipes]
MAVGTKAEGVGLVTLTIQILLGVRKRTTQGFKESVRKEIGNFKIHAKKFAGQLPPRDDYRKSSELD